MTVLHWILELLFPARCVLCRRVLEQGTQDLCVICRTQAPEFPNGKSKLQFLDSFTSVWYYEGSVRRSLLRYKFYGARSYGPVYGRLLAMKLLKEGPQWDVLTWIPISTRRRMSRGYDQVALLAGEAAKQLGVEPVPTLKKIRHNPAQSGIHGAAQRRANVLGAYRVLDSALVRGKRVLLLDDILTTGATAGEAARVLLTAGAKEVHCAAVAAARKE